MSRPRVAIAVVSYNTRELLRKCLASVQADHEAGVAQVWVVDNGSDDGSVEMVRSEFPWVHLEVPDSNLGYGPAVNRVIAASDCEWVAASNADVALHPGALTTMLDAVRRRPRVGIVAPKLVMANGTTQQSFQPYPGWRTSARRVVGLVGTTRRQRSRVFNESGGNEPTRALWATAAFVALRREALEEAGGFNPDQWMYAEDLDLSWRFARRGWATLYVPEARVDHAVSAASREAFGAHLDSRWIGATYRWAHVTLGPLRTRAIALLEWIAASLWAGIGSLRPARRSDPRVAALKTSVPVHRNVMLKGTPGAEQRPG